MLYLIILAITVAITIYAFNNSDVFAKLEFNPYQVYHRREWYRLLTCGFIHADWTHLIFNMLSFFFFAGYVENTFGGMMFLSLYLSSIVFANLTTLIKHKDNYLYNSVGASGGVSAIIFAYILLNPWGKIYVYFIPMPSILYAILFLVYSYYMAKRQADNINHDAHFLGAVYGLAFPILIYPQLISYFIEQITSIL